MNAIGAQMSTDRVEGPGRKHKRHIQCDVIESKGDEYIAEKAEEEGDDVVNNNDEISQRVRQ